MEPTCQACHLSSAEGETSCEYCGEPSGNTWHWFMDLTENTPEGGSGWMSASPAGTQPDETDNDRRQRIQFMADRIAHLTSISDALDQSVRRRMQKTETE
ncbi:Hypothetical predicted protein [Cloeon dipterum]|uniref:Uncharacterized protein n=1 Tax=Cloeon dipterum TaxID=197152 RepID=A0A8S1D7V9_9INSE|nr:Hypothetical predicted protein [Cloeon dipterum]